MVRFIYTDRCLHGPGGQAYLVSFDDSSTVNLQSGPGPLNRVGVIEPELGIFLSEYPDLSLVPLSVVEALSQPRVMTLSSSILLLVSYFVSKHANSRGFHFNDITCLQPPRRIKARPCSCRGSSNNNVSGQ